MARSRSRSATARSDRRESNPDETNSPRESQPESASPLSFEYETEDGLKVTVKPGEVELSREYELTENDLIELSAGIDFSTADVEVKKKGLDLEASGEVSLPGNLLGVSAGIVIDLKTGEISGGELGVELGGVGIEVSAEGENGCQKAIKLSIGGIGISYVRDDCNDDEEEEDEDETQVNKKKEESKPKASEPPKVFSLPLGKWVITKQWRTGYYYKGGWASIKDISINEPSDIRDFFLLSEEEENYMVGKLAGTTKKPWSQINNPPYDSIEISSYIREDGPNARSYQGPYDYYVPGIPVGTPPLSASRNTQGVILSNIFSSITFNVYKYFASSSPDSKRIAVICVAGIQFSAPDTLYGYFPLELENTIDIIKIKSSSQKAKPLPTSPPPMRDNPKCCQETSEMLADIYDALNVDEILSKGVKTPNRLIAYGASKQTTHKDYLSLLAFLIREIDHLGIHPFEVNIADTNPALEGDQSVSLEFVNATAVAKQLIELSLENKGDAAARLNLQVRSARIQVQILNAVVVISRMVQGLINYVGMPIREIVDNVTMPFDITLGNRRKFSGKGFGNAKKPDLIQEINKNTEQATEEILDKFLKEEKQPVVSETYDANEPGLLELIQRFIKR